MAQKTVTFSLEESVIKKINEMAESRADIASKSHLVTIAVINEYAKYVKHMRGK